VKGSHALRRALRSLGEQPFLHLVTVGMIAYSLLLVATFMLMVIDISAFIGDLGKDVQITAYLREDLPTTTIFEIKADLESSGEVSAVRFQGKEEALERFTKGSPSISALVEDLGENPLPASLEISLVPSARSPERIEAFASSLVHPEFEEVVYARETIQRAHAFVRLVRMFGALMGLLLVAGSVFVIGSTIQLAIYSRRDEIEIARLVGGTDTFVGLPFVLEGVLQGFFGALVALGILGLVFRFVLVRLQESLGIGWILPELQFLPLSNVLIILVLGVGLGVAGALYSLRKFLASDTELL
jgi:cell division transport system permease protein